MNSVKAHTRKDHIVRAALPILFIAGLVLTYFEIEIYQKTLISWYIPTGVWIGSGLITNIEPFGFCFAVPGHQSHIIILFCSQFFNLLNILSDSKFAGSSSSAFS